NYPFDKRKDITKLDIRYKDLAGSLNLEGFDNLKELFCSGNKFTSLNIKDCTKLEELDCSFNNLVSLSLPSGLRELKRFSCNDNLLTNLVFTSFNVDRLISLNIANNNFNFSGKDNLSVF